MLRKRIIFLTVFGTLFVLEGNVCIAQTPAPATQQGKPQPGLASLKICLRLQDDSPFLGAVSIRVTPEEGYEVTGAPAETPGDFLFTEVPPGKYFVEISAPGFLAARLSTEVESGHRQKTMFILMKPRAAPQSSAKNEVAGTASLAGVSLETPRTGALGNSLPPETSAARDLWRPHELEEDVPEVDTAVPCPMQEILQSTGQRMREFVSTLEKFTAIEKVEHYTVNSAGVRKGPETRSFEYLVMVTQEKGGKFFIDELRNGSTEVEQFPAHIATEGLPAMALIFHPYLASDFDFRCEGLGQWGGRGAWQIHFLQRADRPVRIRSYYVGVRIYQVQLEGRAWIDPGNQQVMRLESELAVPIPDIDLKSEHLMIDYAPVEFHSTGQKIWLPKTAELYVERQGKRYYRVHTFKEFKLFNVETTQNIQAPKGSYSFTNVSDQDVTGELTVMPKPEMNYKAVILRFVIPARAHVYKSVGPGKDVNLPAEAIASATFAYDGPDGSVQVDALLMKETTLDVIVRH